MSVLRQTSALVVLGLKELPQRKGSSIVIALGIGVAVAVLSAMLAMGEGVHELALSSARPDRVVIRSTGGGHLGRDELGAIASLPQIGRGDSGAPLASGELNVSVRGRRVTDNVRVDIRLTGVDPQYFPVHPELKLLDGRMFRSGIREIIVGKDAAVQYHNLGLGETIRLRNADWTIVGHFQARGILDNAMLTDIRNLSYDGSNPEFSQISAILVNAQSFSDFARQLASNPVLNVNVRHEAEAQEEDVGPVMRTMNYVSYVIGGLMAIGAVLGAINTMHATIDGRRREIATLRALGYGGFSIILAIVVETLVLAILGAGLGLLAVRLFFNGLQVTQVGYIFPLAVTTKLLFISSLWAIGIGLLGGVLPAIRGSRLSIIEALRGS
jgi:putative ABC transport system permease protein